MYFDFGGVRRGWGTSWKIIDARPGDAQRDIAPHGMAVESPSFAFRRAAFTASWSGAGPAPLRAPCVPDRGHPLGVALGLRLGRERDHVGQLRHRREVAQLGEPGQPERVQAVAGQERQIGSSGCTTRPAA